jgi:phage-related protein
MDSSNNSKELVWLSGDVKTPPFSQATRIEVGFLLRQLQEGEMFSMPVCKPMSSIGKHCYELRVNDNENSKSWRIVYRIDDDAILVLDVFAKTTDKTPKQIINNCQKRLKLYDEITGAD